MKMFRLSAICLIAFLAFAMCLQPAAAQNPHHFRVALISSSSVHAEKAPKEKAVLEPLIAGFGFQAPVDGGGNDEWPCFPGSSNANAADCSSIATGGAVIGSPAYTQSFANCDADSSSSSTNCGQVFWFYQDDTGDTTDDLVVSLVVKQGKNYILDTGAIDFGPNPFTAGSVVVIYDDTAFGTLGQTGPGNGFCAGSTETCANPAAGPISAVATTTVGKSTITQKFNLFLE